VKSDARTINSACRRSTVCIDRVRRVGVKVSGLFGVFVVESRILRLAFALMLAALSGSASEPFLRLRETNLGYRGSDAEFTNLTEIRIGWFGPTNLDDRVTGDLWWAANLAISEANEQAVPGGRAPMRRLPLRLVPCWAVDPWGSGVSQLTRMVYAEQPLALLGSVDSATTHLAEQVVAKANLPLISPIATDKSITLAGVSWMFSCAPDDDVIARVLVDHLLTTLEGSSPPPSTLGSGGQSGDDKTQNRKTERSGIALITCTDHESRMTAGELVKEFSRRGRLPALRLEVPPATHDFSRQLRALQEARPAAVVVVAGPEDAAHAVAALRAAGAPASLPENPPAVEPSGLLGDLPENASQRRGAASLRIFGSHAMSRSRFWELAGPAAEGVCFPVFFVPDPADAETRRFLSHFAAERRGVPDYTAALAYDATRVLIEAIRRAGPSRARIREELSRLSPWAGVAGAVHFDGTGHNTRTNVCMATIRSGAIVPLKPMPIQNTKTRSSAKL
jgi:branched-chain amino acid transport system substrate-binding protein